MNNYKKLTLILALALGTLAHFDAGAETRDDRLQRRHEVRVGWGDQIFESTMWRNPDVVINTMPEDKRYTYKENYRYSQHVFGEYQYRLNKCIGLGALVDYSSCHWDNVVRNGKGAEVSRERGNYFANIAVLPTIRFTYLNSPWINLYSGVGAGLDINTGTETDGYGRKTAYAPAVNLTFFGLSASWRMIFAGVELGGMYALKSKDCVYMLNSRLVSVNVGVRF